MINKLLKEELPKDYDITRGDISLTTYNAKGIFQKADVAACQSCKTKRADYSNCNETIMKIDTNNQNLIIVENEQYLKQFDGKLIAKGGRCDLLIFDDTYKNKIMFCDMSCNSQKYFESKKAKVRQQTTDSMVRFLNKPSGLAFVNQFSEKQLVFFRRDSALIQNATSPQRGDVIQNMQAFITGPADTSEYIESNESINETPVKFIIVNYPNTYNW